MSGDIQGLLVKPEAAKQQIQAEIVISPPAQPAQGGNEGGSGAEGGDHPEPGGATVTTEEPGKPLPRRFYGTVALDATRVGRDARASARKS